MDGNLPDGLRTLPYIGGKSNFTGPGAWIATNIRVPCRVYVEPFAGALSILLRRKPVDVEVVNDKDDRICDFFRVVRDHPEDFARHLKLTMSRSRSEFQEAKKNIQSNNRILKAVAVFTILRNSIPASLLKRSTYAPVTALGKWDIPNDVYKLADRLSNVRIESRCGLEIISRHVNTAMDTLIYIDPPYPGTLGYDNSVDNDALIKAITGDGVTSKIAVSGYRDSWPELEIHGYRRIDRPFREQTSRSNQYRVESLWLSWGSVGIPNLFT